MFFNKKRRRIVIEFTDKVDGSMNTTIKTSKEIRVVDALDAINRLKVPIVMGMGKRVAEQNFGKKSNRTAPFIRGLKIKDL